MILIDVNAGKPAPQQVRGVARQFLKRLVTHDWPGNIRELENILRSALTRTPYLTTYELRELGSYATAVESPETIESLAPSVISNVKQAKACEKKEKNIYDKIHQEVDRVLFSSMLTHVRENQSEAARFLGISRLTLRKKLKYQSPENHLRSTEKFFIRTKAHLRIS